MSEKVARSLDEHGNAVLLLPTPRWEKETKAHVQSFWADIMIPMIRLAAAVEFSESSQSRPRTEVSSRPGSFGRPDSTDFVAKWLDAVNSGAIGESNVFIGIGASVLHSSVVLSQTSSVCYFDRLTKQFSLQARTAISKCLIASELVLGVGPPPFGSVYIVSRMS